MRYALTLSLSAELHAAVKSLEENNTLKTKVESLKRDVDGGGYDIRSLFLRSCLEIYFHLGKHDLPTAAKNIQVLYRVNAWGL